MSKPAEQAGRVLLGCSTVVGLLIVVPVCLVFFLLFGSAAFWFAQGVIGGPPPAKAPIVAKAKPQPRGGTYISCGGLTVCP